MRKHILPRLKSLLSAACAPFAGRVTQTPEATLERTDVTPDADTWLFESDTALEASRSQLSGDLNAIADGLSDLRETLAMIHGETPLPREAAAPTPCAIIHHDDMLFEGEADHPFMPAQEEVSGGEGMFLFGDAPSFQDELPAHQHAA